MNRWLQILFFILTIGLSRAHHFMKVVILAAMGLAGLWMVHTLAQDYDKISHNFGSNLGKLTQSFGLASAGQEDDTKQLFKRSLEAKQPPEINWDLVLSRDPASCARSFICQLVAQQESTLKREEKIILHLAKCVFYIFF